jgi:hypothetical protein
MAGDETITDTPNWRSWRDLEHRADEAFFMVFTARERL